MDKSEDKNEKLENTATKKDLNATDLADKSGVSLDKKEGGDDKVADWSVNTKQAKVWSWKVKLLLGFLSKMT